MTHEINCPACRQLLYLPKKEDCHKDSTEIMCDRCSHKYAAVYLKTKSFTNSLKTPDKPKYRRTYSQQVYELQALTPSQTVKKIQFSTPGEEEKFSASSGDELILLYTMQNDRVSELIFLKNCTTRNSCQLFFPGKVARLAGLKTAATTLAGGSLLSLLGGFSTGVSTYSFLVATLVSTLGAGVYVARSKRKKYLERNSQIVARLSSEQKILARLYSLSDRIDKLHQDLAKEQRLIDRLAALKQKMTETDPDLYAHRIETLDRGLDALEKQLGISENLIQGYSQLADILNIEYETSRLAGEIPELEDVDLKVFDRLEELNALEVQKQELTLLIDPAVET